MNAQSLLSERRSCVLEQSRSTDATARAMLQFRIDQIDRELHERSERSATVDLMYGAVMGPTGGGAK